jgi:hypothetical protein
MILEESKVKLKYFATFVLDMAKALKKQVKLQQTHHIPTQTTHRQH